MPTPYPSMLPTPKPSNDARPPTVDCNLTPDSDACATGIEAALYYVIMYLGGGSLFCCLCGGLTAWTTSHKKIYSQIAPEFK